MNKSNQLDKTQTKKNKQTSRNSINLSQQKSINRTNLEESKHTQSNDRSDLRFLSMDDFTRLDPLMVGYNLLYLQSQYLFIRLLNQEEERNEMLNVRVSVKPNESLKIELMSDIDVFFHQMIVLNPEQFKQLATEQQLNMQFHQLPDIIVKTLVQATDSKTKVKAILLIKPNGQTHLIFEKHFEFSTTVMLQLDLIPLNEKQIKQQVMYKFNVYRHKERQLKIQSQEKLGHMRRTNELLFDRTIHSIGLITDKI